MLGATIGLAAVNSVRILRAFSSAMTPFTASIDSSVSTPQTRHIGQRRLQRVAKSISSRSGISGTGSGVQL